MLQKLKITSSIALVALFLLVTAHQSNASTQSQQSNTLTNFKHDYLPNYTVNSIESEQTGIKLANGWGHFKNKRKHYCERKRRGRLPQSRSCRSYRARHAAKARAKFFKRMRAMQKRKSLKLKRSRKSSSSRARTTNNSGGAAAQARIAQLEKDLAASRRKEQAMITVAMRVSTAAKVRIAQLERELAAAKAKEQASAQAAARVAAAKAKEAAQARAVAPGSCGAWDDAAGMDRCQLLDGIRKMLKRNIICRHTNKCRYSILPLVKGIGLTPAEAKEFVQYPATETGLRECRGRKTGAGNLYLFECVKDPITGMWEREEAQILKKAMQ